MMIIWLLILAALLLYKSRIVSYHDGFLDRETTDSIKGVFVLIVLLSHVRGYISAGEGMLNMLYEGFFRMIGQLMVATFLFYSGYGCHSSYKSKINYVDSFLRRRVLKTLLHFALAIVPFAILNALLHIEFPARNYLLCWIGWESIGNSNWYIFTILVLYCATWVSFKLEKFTGLELSIPFVSAFSVAYIYFMHKVGKESWWYDTALCFPVGMLVSQWKGFICRQTRRTGVWIAWTVMTLAAFLLTYHIGGLFFFFCAGLFCLLILLITIKVKIGNGILKWTGAHLFGIYLLQRLPMIILSCISLQNSMVFTAITIAVTYVFAFGFHKMLAIVDKALFSEKIEKRAAF